MNAAEERINRLRNSFRTNELNLPAYDTDDLINSNKIEDIVVPISNNRCMREKKTVFTINSINRAEYEIITVPKNPITNLYSSDIIDSSDNLITVLYTAEILNNTYIATSNDPIYPYFQEGDLIKRRIFKYKEPNNYKIELTKKFVNIKSLRLLSVEIPNVINNITPNNNIIMIDIIDNATNNSIPLKLNKSPVDYIIIQLDVGFYTIDELILAMKNKVNNIVNDYNDLLLNNIFDITYNKTTGLININLVNYAPYNLSFNLKFWYNNKNYEYLDLWYMLGFSYYHEINSDGSDKYVKTLSNAYNFGINTNLQNFNRPEFEILKPFKQPNINPINYIYLIINNIEENILDMTENRLKNIFAKIILNVNYGEITTIFINTPKIFDTTINNLSHLNIEWRDYLGNLVNFQDINHSLTFEIIEYIDELEEINMNTKRGIYDKQYYPTIIKNN